MLPPPILHSGSDERGSTFPTAETQSINYEYAQTFGYQQLIPSKKPGGYFTDSGIGKTKTGTRTIRSQLTEVNYNFKFSTLFVHEQASIHRLTAPMVVMTP